MLLIQPLLLYDSSSTTNTSSNSSSSLPIVLLQSEIVRTLIESTVSTIENHTLQRFITALCTCYQHTIYYILTPILQYNSNNSTTTASAGVKTSEPDFLDFNASHTISTSAEDNNTETKAHIDLILQGNQEKKHNWNIVHDHLYGISYIKHLCLPLSIQKDSKSETKVKNTQKLVEILIQLLENSVFTIKTFKK